MISNLDFILIEHKDNIPQKTNTANIVIDFVFWIGSKINNNGNFKKTNSITLYVSFF